MTDGNLETERLYLRRITLDDADLMLAIWNDPSFVRNVGDRGIHTIEQARDAVRSGPLQLFASFGYGPFAVVRKSDGERAGVCGLFKREILEYPDIGFALLPGYRGMGLAREASSAVVTHARDDLGLEEIAAIVSPENGPSIALIEKLGLSFAGMITMPGDDKEICLYGMVLRP
jgi:RimJ/RimL family protein N-acetyltransferase